MKAKNLTPVLINVINIVTPFSDKLINPMDPNTKLWIVIIGIIVTILLITIWYLFKDDRDKKHSQELQRAILLIFQKDISLFNDYMQKLKERRHLLPDESWDFLKELDAIDSENKKPKVSR